MTKAKNHETTSVTFDKRDPAQMELLEWARSRPLPMDYTHLVQHALQQLRQQLEGDGPAPAIDLAAIEAAVERATRRALTRANLTLASSSITDTDVVDLEVETEANLASLF